MFQGAPLVLLSWCRTRQAVRLWGLATRAAHRVLTALELTHWMSKVHADRQVVLQAVQVHHAAHAFTQPRAVQLVQQSARLLPMLDLLTLDVTEVALIVFG